MLLDATAKQLYYIITKKMKENDTMLCDNLKTLRKSKGLSQEELAIKLSVVRQTVSKWENGLFCA